MLCAPDGVADERCAAPLLALLQVLEDPGLLLLGCFGREVVACVETPGRGSCGRKVSREDHGCSLLFTEGSSAG